MERKQRIGAISKRLAGLCKTSEFFRCAGKYAVPSDESVREILDLFQEIIFIGYFGRQNIPGWESESHLHVLMSKLTMTWRARSPRACATNAWASTGSATTARAAARTTR